MIDIHTHILPGIDDGAPDVKTSIEMLRMEKEQYVHTVVLTPHFYREREHVSTFLQRRDAACDKLNEAIDKLPKAERDMLPRTIVGAEVAWVPNLVNLDRLDNLFIGNGKYMLVELPFSYWSDEMVHQMYNLQVQAGVTPVVAHFERYLSIQKSRMLEAVLEMGFPIQIGTDCFAQGKGRHRVLRLLKNGLAQIIASDCHNLVSRPPNLFSTMQFVERKLGADVVKLIHKSTAGVIAE